VTVMTRKRLALIALLVVSLAGALTVGTWAATRASGRPGGAVNGPGHGMMGGGMMGGYGLAGNGQRVTSLNAARARAQAFADSLGLRTGEVIQFSNGFYATLLTAERAGATEVLIDLTNGGVGVEYGPAMMWNTSYGMHAAGVARPMRVSAADATRLAQRWLDGQRRGLTAGEPEQFPGYYTMETLRGRENRRDDVGAQVHRGGVLPHLARVVRGGQRGVARCRSMLRDRARLAPDSARWSSTTSRRWSRWSPATWPRKGSRCFPPATVKPPWRWPVSAVRTWSCWT